MDLKDYKHRARFEGTASISRPSEQDRFIAHASLLPLKGLLPAGVDPENDPDLLYFSCNGAVVGLVNLNGHGISKDTALAIHQSAKHKYVTTEHDREKVVGFILQPGLTRFGTNEPLTEEVAATLQEPFNMAFSGILWKVINPMLSQYIRQQRDSVGKDVLSMSWEIAYSTYDIGVGSRNLFDARVIKADDPSFAAYDKMLRGNGGEGRDSKGQEVFCIINGDAIVLGYSVVPNPAAAVKGILPIESVEKPKTEAIEIAFKLPEEGMQELANQIQESVLKKVREELLGQVRQSGLSTSILEDSQEKNITPSNASVTINTPKSMKIETVEQLESALGKHEATAAVVDFVKAIKDASEKFAQEVHAKEDLVKNAELAKEENENRAKELKASLDEVKKELAEVRAAQETSIATQKFQERMASFDEEFDLDDEDRSILASQIKNLDDAGFESFAKSCKKLMAGKSKSSKKDNPFKKEKDDDKEDKKDKSKDEDKEGEKSDASIKAALASVTEDKGQSKIPNGTEVDEDLKARVAASFGQSIRIDGKTIDERKAAKAAKAKK